MPSLKGKADDKSTRNITDFFKTFQAPPAGVPAEDDDGNVSDEIVVAASSHISVTNVNRKNNHAAASTPKRGPGRPRKVVSAANVGSQSSGTGTPRRGPGRPRKDAAIEKPLQVVVDISSDDSSQPDGLTSSPSSPSAANEALDHVPTHAPSGTSAPRGEFEAVLVHSPKVKRTTDVSMLPSQTANNPGNLATLSFSSMGSLSTAPISTQSSSMRIVKDGMQAVTNSESDSGESSGEDLADVQDLFPVKRRKLTPSPKSKTAASGNSVRRSTRTSATPRTTGIGKLQPDFEQPPSTKKYKYDLAKMAAQAKKRDLADARIAELEYSAQKNDVSPSSDGKGTLSDSGKAFVAAAVGSDVDEQERMMQALDRTEALQQAEKFYFFLDDKPVHDAEPFPVDALPPERCLDLLRSEESRASAFTTGYVRDLPLTIPLPPAVIDWMMHQLLHEKDSFLCEAYLLTLTELASKGHVSRSLRRISEFYNTISLFRDTSPGRDIIERPHGLTNVARLISVCAPAFDEHVGDHTIAVDAFLDLALLGIDDRISRDASFCIVLEQCIEDLLEGVSDKDFALLLGQLIGILFQTKRISLLTRCRLIASLPETTPSTSKIRRQLALESFRPPDMPRIPRNARHDWPSMLLEALKTDPNLRISDSADYKLIQALAVVFDIAIGAGFTPYEQLAPDRGTTTALGPFGAIEPPLTEAAKVHDKFIDGVTTELRAMSSRIRGSGAAHLARTEAKSTIERMIVRLETSVRTRPKLRNDVFGGTGATRSVADFFGARGGDGPVTSGEADGHDDAGDEMNDGQWKSARMGSSYLTDM